MTALGSDPDGSGINLFDAWPTERSDRPSEDKIVNTDIPRKSAQREKLLTPTDISQWLGVSPAWVRDHATHRKPRLPSVRLGKLLRFRADDIEQFLRRQGIAA